MTRAAEPGHAGTVSERYRGDEGTTYFAYQVGGAEIAARTIAPRFTPYVRADDHVVDFGCGTGWLLKVLPGAEKIGIEPNPSAREVADTLGIRTVPSPLDIADGWADVVISSHALEHSLSPYEELVALRRIVKPGGRLVILLPIDDWRVQRRPAPDNPDHHLFTWTPLVFANLLQEAGYEVESSSAFTYALPYYNQFLYGRVPRALFDLIARAFGVLVRYRQLLAVAHVPQS